MVAAAVQTKLRICWLVDILFKQMLLLLPDILLRRILGLGVAICPQLIREQEASILRNLTSDCSQVWRSSSGGNVTLSGTSLLLTCRHTYLMPVIQRNGQPFIHCLCIQINRQIDKNRRQIDRLKDTWTKAVFMVAAILTDYVCTG